jgi:hypothetical protein
VVATRRVPSAADDGAADGALLHTGHAPHLTHPTRHPTPFEPFTSVPLTPHPTWPLPITVGASYSRQTHEFVASSFERELRECSFLLEDEFWPEEDDPHGPEDTDDADLKRVADKAAVERVLSAHDYFDILSLPRDASQSDVKKAFFKLSKEVHPDKNGAKRANEAFDALNTAKLTLMDPEAREAYAKQHPPRAAVAREWAKQMDATGRASWNSTAPAAPYHRGRG